MTSPFKNIPVTGSDFFMLALGYPMRRYQEPRRNLCRLVMELDGRLDIEKLSSAVNSSKLLTRMANARISYSLPFTMPQWTFNGRTVALPVTEHRCKDKVEWSNGTPAALKLSPAVGPQKPPGIAFDIIRYDGGSSEVMLSWNHLLMDAIGAEFLMKWIGDHAASGNSMAKLLKQNHPYANRNGSILHFLKRLHYSRKSVQRISEASKAPLASMHSKGTQDLETENLSVREAGARLRLSQVRSAE